MITQCSRKFLKRVVRICESLHIPIGTLHRRFDAARYWEHRYVSGGTSGAGSYNHMAEFKAAFLNSFVKNWTIGSVIEFGCGDGNQLALTKLPHYIGYDVSDKAVALCRARFADDETKSFYNVSEWKGTDADLALSLDVIYHLVDDDIFERYMGALFAAARKFVIIYSSDSDSYGEYDVGHIKHRKFSKWIAANLPKWSLIECVPSRGGAVSGAAGLFGGGGDPGGVGDRGGVMGL